MAREKPVEMPTLQDMIAQDCATYRKRIAELKLTMREAHALLLPYLHEEQRAGRVALPVTQALMLLAEAHDAEGCLARR